MSRYNGPIPDEDSKVLAEAVIYGPTERGAYDGYAILWEVKDKNSEYFGLQLETFTSLGAEHFEKNAKKLSSIGVDVNDIVGSKPTRAAHITVKHREYKGQIQVQGKYFDAVRFGGTVVDDGLKARLARRAALLKAGKPVVDAPIAQSSGFGDEFDEAPIGDETPF